VLGQGEGEGSRAQVHGDGGEQVGERSVRVGEGARVGVVRDLAEGVLQSARVDAGAVVVLEEQARTGPARRAVQYQRDVLLVRFQGDAVGEQGGLPVDERRQPVVEQGGYVAAVEALREPVEHAPAVRSFGEQRGQGHDDGVVQARRKAAAEHGEEFVAAMEVELFVGVQDAAGEARFAVDDALQEPLGGGSVLQHARLDGAPVAQAEGGGGQRELEVQRRVTGEGDGAHRQGRYGGEPGGSGADGPFGEMAEGQRVDGQGEVAAVPLRQAEGAGGGPPAGEAGDGARGEVGQGHGCPAQFERRVEFRCVAPQFRLAEPGPAARCGVDGVVLIGRERVEGQ
jgi:hypothetical protein